MCPTALGRSIRYSFPAGARLRSVICRAHATSSEGGLSSDPFAGSLLSRHREALAILKSKERKEVNRQHVEALLKESIKVPSCRPRLLTRVPFAVPAAA